MGNLRLPWLVTVIQLTITPSLADTQLLSGGKKKKKKRCQRCRFFLSIVSCTTAQHQRISGTHD